MENAWLHTTVLLNEAVDSLLNGADTATGTFVDATFGRGGHSRRILERLGPQARLIAFDKDPEAIAEAAAPSLAESAPIALVSQPEPRRALFRLLKASGLSVLAFGELPEGRAVDVIAVVGDALLNSEIPA